MLSHSRMDEYGHEDYNEYGEDASGEEWGEEEEEEEAPPSHEQQEFLKLREELKEKYRQKIKKEAVGAFGRSQLLDRKRTTTNDTFGSFFGPSQPVIASRVLDERRSIRETQHIISRIPSGSSGNVNDSTASTSSGKKPVVHKQQHKFVNEVKKKAQTLKDMRDYSFLLSDDSDFPDVKEEQRPVRTNPAANSDRRFDQAPAKSKLQMSKPGRPVPNGHGLKQPAAKTPQSQTRVGLGNGAAFNTQKPPTTIPRKIDNTRNGNGHHLMQKPLPSKFSARPIMQKPLPSKISAQTTGTSKPLAKVSTDPYLKSRPSVAALHSSAQKNHYAEQKRPTPNLNNIKPMPNKPLPSSKSQPPKKIPPHDIHEGRLKKKPMKRRLDDDDDEDAIGMIRKMFRYNPSKYSAVDDDVSDMEADFHEIEREERRSAKLARQEDEEQLRLIEEDERRERMKKKQKLKRQ